jgi:hypothetical protein
MDAQITVTLPEDVLQRAELLAERIGRPVADLLADTIELALRPLGEPTDDGAIAKWPDEEVLAATDTELPPAEDDRLSKLLDRQQADMLSDGERSDLVVLMQRYQEGLFRKAQAWHEAVRRGLRSVNQFSDPQTL